MITVHHLNQSRSTRILWLLEELGLPYEVVHHQRDPQTRLAPPSLAKVHPLSKAPIIVDGDLTLCESGAITEYLLDKIKDTSLRPTPASAEYYAYLEWLHFAEGSLSLPVIGTFLMGMEERSGNSPMDGYIAKEIALDLSYIETTLTDRAFFAGEQFSAADIMMCFLLQAAKGLGLLEGRPSTLSYLAKLETREAYQRAAALG